MDNSVQRKIYSTKYLFTALGLPLRGRWSERKCKLMGALVQFGVQCLIVDDAHDLSLEHLIFIKELTDQGCLPPYDHPLGLCLVTAGRGATIPLKEIFDQPDTMWIQFRRRLDKLDTLIPVPLSVPQSLFRRNVVLVFVLLFTTSSCCSMLAAP